MMALVPAQCTQCGGNIEVDDTHEAGICKFCGTPFVTEKAINNYTTNITNNIVNNNNFNGANINIVSENIDNYIELAKSALVTKNDQEALKFCEKALQIDAKSAKAWSVKMEAELVRSCKAGYAIEDGQSVESISVAGNNAIKYAQDSEKSEYTLQVHTFYIKAACDLMNILQLSIQCENMNVISTLAQTNKNAALAQDQMYMLGITTKDLFVRKLIEDVTPQEISANTEMQDLLVKFINLYVDFRNRYKERTLLYSGGPNVEAVSAMKQCYNQLVNKLPESKRNEIKPWTIVGCANNPASNENCNGCYIATCVYGSYDCPQVWTLRRYRDYTLDETWYGRLFIKCYYAVSPNLVRWFGKYEWFRKPWKKFLDSMVSHLNSMGIADTKYKDKY